MRPIVRHMLLSCDAPSTFRDARNCCQVCVVTLEFVEIKSGPARCQTSGSGGPRAATPQHGNGTSAHENGHHHERSITSDRARPRRRQQPSTREACAAHRGAPAPSPSLAGHSPSPTLGRFIGPIHWACAKSEPSVETSLALAAAAGQPKRLPEGGSQRQARGRERELSQHVELLRGSAGRRPAATLPPSAAREPFRALRQSTPPHRRLTPPAKHRRENKS